MATLQVRLDFTVAKSPLVPFNCTICSINGPKRPQKAPRSAQCAPTPRNQARAVSWAMWLKTEFRGHLVHPHPLTFCVFEASESSNEPPRPPYQWSLGGAGGQPGPRTGHLLTWRHRPGPPPVNFWLKTWIWQGHYLSTRMAKVQSNRRPLEGEMAKAER